MLKVWFVIGGLILGADGSFEMYSPMVTEEMSFLGRGLDFAIAPSSLSELPLYLGGGGTMCSTVCSHCNV